MHYLITGGTGFIGQYLIQSLDQEHDVITVLSRQSPKNPVGYRHIKNLSELGDDSIIDVVINLAGSPIDRRWTPSVKNDLMDSRLKTTQSLIALFKRLSQKPKMMISASAIGYYGSNHTDSLDEYSDPHGSFTHELCHAWEVEAKKAEEWGIRVCIARLGVVLGYDGGVIKKLSTPFKLGLGGRLGTGTQLFSWIHIDDVVLGLQHLIRNSSSRGPYNFVAPASTTNREFTDEMGGVLKRPTVCSLPARWVKLLFGEMGDELLLRGSQIIPKRLLAEGYQFKFSSINTALSDVFKIKSR